MPELVGREALLWLSKSGTIAADPGAPQSIRSADPGDECLIDLAASERAILVSGDRHLLDLAEEIPALSPVQFRAHLSRG